MAEARGRQAWAPTSAVMALLANIHRDPKKHRAFRPSDFNPYETKRKTGMPIAAGNIGVLKKAFVKKTKPPWPKSGSGRGRTQVRGANPKGIKP